MKHASLNRCFRLVRRADAQPVPVPETARGHGAGRALTAATAAIAVGAMLTTAPFALAAPPGATQLPTGGQLAAGQANWQSQGTTLTVNQPSQRAVIDWQSFNLGAQATVVFNQAAGRSGATLNRVLDSAPSQILGRIQAPGQVFISNPSGVIFGSSASVDVGGLVATTLSMGAADFMAGSTLWQRNGATGAVVNAGALTAADGGFIALLAPEVRNAGVIVARAGTVALAAGEAIRLEFSGNGLSSVQITPAQLRTLVENRHAILAQGGLVILAARSADALRSGVVNQAGVIDASSVISRGGRVLIEADDITLAAGSRIDASGVAGGGSVLVGGDWQGSGTQHQATHVAMAAGARIDANASRQGDGGKVVLWSDTARADSSTSVQGSITARGGAQGGDGGRIETSGHRVATAGATVDASAAKGVGGVWLIDPTDLVIGASEAAGYRATLESGTNVLVQTASTGSGAGDITVASPLSWENNASSTLTLSAARNININASIGSGQGTLTLEYGQGAAAAGNTSHYSVNAPVNLRDGQHFNTKLGSDGTTIHHTVITALGLQGDTNPLTLQGISSNLAGHYVLGSSINGGAAVNWNNGAGFAPLGNNSTPFTGTFDGLGHHIYNLPINRPTSDFAGLFGNVGAAGSIANLGLSGASVTGRSEVGALAGHNEGSLSNVYSSGSVRATQQIAGGLVGNAISGSISNAYSTATVVSDGNYAGGLVGNNGSAISFSYATGNARGADFVGGLAGWHNANPGSSLANTYASGTATGSGAGVGSLTGVRDSGSIVTNSAGGMDTHAAATFAGFDLIDRWTIVDGRTTPLLNAFLYSVTVTAAPTTKTYDGTLAVAPGSDTLSEPGRRAFLHGSLHYVGAAAAAGTYNGVTLAGYYSDQGDITHDGVRVLYAPLGTLSVTPAALTVTGAAAANKVYDGTTTASVTGALSGVIGGDSVSLVSSASFADKNVGTAKPVTASFALSGSAAGNYTLAQPAGLHADITPAPLAVTGAVVAGKVYDGSTAATLGGATLAGVIGSDAVSLSTSAVSFADKNVGSAKPVTASFAITGADAGNYALAQPAGLHADITPAPLAVTGATAASKVYDGSTAATLGGATLAGVIGSDAVSLSTSAASFADKNVGSAKPVTASFAITGADAGNYALAQPAGLHADITPAPLAVTGATAASKVYDGSTAATLGGATLAGVIGSDAVSLSTSAASFADKNVGTAKPVTASFAITGADAGNYALAQPAGLHADITPAPLAVTGATAASKVYDGSTAATLGGATLAGVIGSDAVSLQSAANFADRNVGTGKAVTASFAITGADAGNYLLVQPATTLLADITQRGSVAWVGGASGDWFAEGNWAGGAVPTLANVANVTIPAGALVTLARTSAANAPMLSSLGGAGGLQMTQATLATSGAVALDSVTLGAGAALTAGSLSTSHFAQSGGTLAVAGVLGIDGSFVQTDGLIRVGGAATVRQASGRLDVQHLVAKSLSLSAVQGDLGFANLGSVGDVALSASGGIAQAEGGSLTVLGQADITAGGKVALDQPRNMVVGRIAVQGQDVSLRQGIDDLVLGKISATGGLTLVAGTGNIRQADASVLTVAGSTTATAAQGSVYLSAAGNAFGGAVSASGNDIAITQGAMPLALGDVAARNNTAIVSGGAITQTGALKLAGNTSIDAGHSDVTLNNTTNDFGQSVSVRSGALTLADGVGGLQLGNVQTSGPMLVESRDGPIAQNAGARFVSTAATAARFNAWQAGEYTSVFVNADVAIVINGQMLSPTALSGGVASALGVLTAPVANGASADPVSDRKLRSLAIPVASPVRVE